MYIYIYTYNEQLCLQSLIASYKTGCFVFHVFTHKWFQVCSPAGMSGRMNSSSTRFEFDNLYILDISVYTCI